jgi:hypothetical protein
MRVVVNHVGQIDGDHQQLRAIAACLGEQAINPGQQVFGLGGDASPSRLDGTSTRYAVPLWTTLSE